MSEYKPKRSDYRRKDFYAILGFDPAQGIDNLRNIPSTEISAHYSELNGIISQTDPEKLSNARTAAIVSAHRVLSDGDLRAFYNETYANTPQGEVIRFDERKITYPLKDDIRVEVVAAIERNEQLDLSNRDLSNQDLSGLNLRNVIFSKDGKGVTATKASFKGSNLSGVNLTHCDFSSARFNGADLTNANLKHSRLEGTVFTDADIKGAHITPTDIRRKYIGKLSASDEAANKSLFDARNYNQANITHGDGVKWEGKFSRRGSFIPDGLAHDKRLEIFDQDYDIETRAGMGVFIAVTSLWALINNNKKFSKLEQQAKEEGRELTGREKRTGWIQRIVGSAVVVGGVAYAAKKLHEGRQL